MASHKHDETMDVFLQPGEYFVGDAHCRLRTILGSCVSITLWNRSRRVGAMCHFLLSQRAPGGPAALDGRYADEALSLMLRDLQREGVPAEECRAKMFGGGDMFPDLHTGAGDTVGRRNGEFARQLLRDHGVPVVAASLFGVGHRRILFDIATGHVWCRQVHPKDVGAAALEEIP
jgi:chemotaxis protein CheD